MHTSESKRDVITIRIVGLYDVNDSVSHGVFTDKHVFYASVIDLEAYSTVNLETCMTLRHRLLNLDTHLTLRYGT